MTALMRRVRLGLFCALFLAACEPGEPAPDQYVRGEALYSAYCATCHEIDGGIGPKLTPRVLATRVTADALFRYTRRFMPYEAGNTLSAEQYWDITGYLLQRHGFVEPGTDVTAETAESLELTTSG